MFTNLIESNSHKREFKRRSSFFIATVAAYALVLFAAGIVGILTYDARVDAQNMDLLLESWIPPVKPNPPPTLRPDRPRAPRTPAKSNAPVDQHITVPERIDRVPPVDDLRKPPADIGTVASNIPPSEGEVKIGNHNADPPSSRDKNGCATCTGESTGPATVTQPTPEPTPVKPTGPQRVTSVVLAGKVVNLPKPSYPMIAKQMRAQGPVNVQIVVDENGGVISAHAVSGSPTLTSAAEDAAKRARFTPTILNGVAVKIQGVITYNFILQ